MLHFNKKKRTSGNYLINFLFLIFSDQCRNESRFFFFFNFNVNFTDVTSALRAVCVVVEKGQQLQKRFHCTWCSPQNACNVSNVRPHHHIKHIVINCRTNTIWTKVSGHTSWSIHFNQSIWGKFLKET